jgi:hypothetical protein
MFDRLPRIDIEAADGTIEPALGPLQQGNRHG